MNNTKLLKLAGLVTGLSLLLAAAPSFAQGPGGRGGRGGQGRGPEAMFEHIDKNADGSITADEAPEHLWERIKNADADGNGAVTLEELQAAHPGGGRGGQGGPGGRGGARGQRPSADQIIERFDEDGSGELTENEVPAEIWARMSAADADRNGAVTLEELDAHHAQRGSHEPGGGDPAAKFKEADANGDGVLTLDEFTAACEKRGGGHGGRGGGRGGAGRGPGGPGGRPPGAPKA